MIQSTLYVALAAVGWGTWSVFVRPTGLPPIWVATLVFALTAPVAFALARARGAPPLGSVLADRQTLGLIAAYSITDAINTAAFFAALQTTSVAVAVLTHCTAPVMVALLAPYVERTKSPGALGAALVAMSGLVILLRPWESAETSMWAGAALGLLSAVGYAGAVFLTRRLSLRIGGGLTIATRSVGASLLLLPLALLTPVAIRTSRCSRSARRSSARSPA